jgi:trimethylamine:corrinoid methyltransferase-like protein
LDRGSIRNWQEEGGLDTFSRAKLRVQALLQEYKLPDVPSAQIAELQTMVEQLARAAGMDRLPEV